MGENSISLAKKKELAKIMYTSNSAMTQKEIAEQVEVSEQTMVAWVRDGKWDTLKTDLLTTNTEQLSLLYQVLKKLNEQAQIAMNDDDPDTNPDTDGIIKITKAIHYLRTRTGVGQMFETGTEFLKFLAKEDAALAKQVAPYFTAFIRQNL